jgi:WD40 repeat protein
VGSDGRVAAVGAHANGAHEVFLGAPGGAAEVMRVPGGGGGGRPGVSVAADGTLAVSGHQPGLVVWKPGAPVPAPAFTNQPTRCPRFAPNGELWAVVNSWEVHRFDPTARAVLAQWQNILGQVVNGVDSLDALAVEGTVAVAGGAEGNLFLLAPDGRKTKMLATLRSPGDPVLSVALARDESLVVAGTQTGKLRTVRVADRTELPAVPAHSGGVTAVSLSATGALLATGGQDRTVRLWKRTGDTFEPLLTVGRLPGPVRQLQFTPGESPAGNRLLVLLDNDRAVRVWDIDRLNAHLAELNLGW